MVVQLLEAIHIFENGRFHAVRAAVVGLPLLLFVLWRLSSHGVFDAEGVMRTVKRDIIADYKQAVYKRHGLYDQETRVSASDAVSAAEELEGIQVTLSNVSMSGSLFSWAANDEIGVRFDYAITRGHDTVKQEKNVYRCTRRQSRTSMWDCGVISYYLKYL